MKRNSKEFISYFFDMAFLSIVINISFITRTHNLYFKQNIEKFCSIILFLSIILKVISAIHLCTKINIIFFSASNRNRDPENYHKYIQRSDYEISRRGFSTIIR